MDTITRNTLQDLLTDEPEGLHVSIYMPAIVAGQQTQQNPIRFKNLVREAESKLRERGMNEHEAEVFLRAAIRLLDDIDFWQHQNTGLAVFVAEDQCYEFRLPIAFQALMVVLGRFYIKPLLPALAAGERFRILALSQNRVRLLECDHHRAREVELENVPRSLADALGHELTSEHLDSHSGHRGGTGAAKCPIYNAQGAGEDDVKPEIRQFFKQLNCALKDYLRPEQPLVLAGVEYLLSIYEQETDFKPIARTITGNFDVEQPETLRARAWEIVEPYFTQARRDAFARYDELSGTGRAANGLGEITLAAIDGRIDTLFVARDTQRWGRLDAQSRKVRVHEQAELADEELLDLTAANTLLKDGQVFVLPAEQIPGGQPQAAILRY